MILTAIVILHGGADNLKHIIMSEFSDGLDNEDTIEIYSDLLAQDFDEAGWDPVVEDDSSNDEDDYGYYKGII